MESMMSAELRLRAQFADVFACSGQQLETLIQFAESNSEAVAAAWLRGILTARQAFQIELLEYLP